MSCLLSLFAVAGFVEVGFGSIGLTLVEQNNGGVEIGRGIVGEQADGSLHDVVEVLGAGFVGLCHHEHLLLGEQLWLCLDNLFGRFHVEGLHLISNVVVGVTKGRIPVAQHKLILVGVLLFDACLAGIGRKRGVAGDSEYFGLMLQVAVFDEVDKPVPVLGGGRHGEQRGWKVDLPAHEVRQRLGAVGGQIGVMVIRALGRSVSMDVDSADFQVFVGLKSNDRADDAVELCRIAAVVGIEGDLVDGEVDVSTLVEMAYLHGFYLWPHERQIGQIVFLERVCGTVFSVAASTEILVESHFVSVEAFVHGYCGKIVCLLRLAVVAAQHGGIGSVASFVIASLIHHLLFTSVDDDFGQRRVSFRGMKNGCVDELCVAGQAQRIEVEIHGQGKKVTGTLYLDILQTHLIVGNGEVGTVLCVGGCDGEKGGYGDDIAFHDVIIL